MFRKNQLEIIQIFTLLAIGGLIAVSWFSLAQLYFPYEIIKSATDRLLFTIGASTSEEVLKFFAVLLLIPLIKLRPAQIPFLGIGFGFAEAFIHIIENDPASTTYHLRPFFAHIIFGLVMALFFSLARKNKKPLLKGLYYSLALILSAILHLAYNLAVRFYALAM